MADNRRDVRILLVEDNDADIRLTLEALKGSKIRNEMHVVRDGIEAMEFLQHDGDYAKSQKPDVILLDLNLPKMDGREVLEQIKQNPDLKMIPVVVLTTSRQHEDVLQSYRLNANCFIRKPVDIDGFFKVVSAIENFWFEIVALPPNPT